MKIYAAGSFGVKGIPDFLDNNCVKLKIPKLYSFLNDIKYIDNYPETKHSSLMVDSGAHSWNKLNINVCTSTNVQKKLPNIGEFSKKYFKYISENYHRNIVFVELDTYGVLSKEKMDAFAKKVFAFRGKAQFIRVYHPQLDGGSLGVLKEWIDAGQTYIGIGGSSYDMLGDIFKITRNDIKLHGFALTKADLLHKYPFYSVDSTSYLSPARYGGVYREGLKSVKNETLIRQKSPEYIIGLDRSKTGEKIEKALINLKKSEIYFTKLWEKRGVVW